ncbi:MAG: integrase arm-type DNA-binding domain-containing protein [Betaproteobacteria bacterium]|nr:integrase arm-type DNA-binding domain-containing protein [Betaproteobacteria bacterium]MBK9786293.1 integrase arm-type DNA-binding domain-containing protein [Candidatus Dechloromonas phosphorivorans]
MAKDKLKDSKCAAEKARDKEFLLSDGAGLSLRVRPTGAKSWVYVFWMDGKQQRMGLGSYPDVSLQKARKKREAARSLIDDGQNPITTYRESKKAAIKEAEEHKKIASGEGPPQTVRQLFNVWRWGNCIQPTDPNSVPTGELANRKDGGAWVQAYFDRDVFPIIGNKILNEVRQSDIWSVRDQMRKRNPSVGRLLNMVLSNLRQMFRFGISRGYTLVEPTIGITKRNFGGTERPRRRWLKEHEIIELSKLLPASEVNPASQEMIWLLLATGCRVGEMSMNSWENINFEERDWFFPKEIRKGNKEHPAENHHVYLTDFIQDRLLNLKKLAGDSAYPFPHKRDRNTHIPVNSLRRQITTDAKETIHTSGGAWTPHDLRRTCATHLESLKFSQKIIDRCLGHYAAGDAVQGAYYLWEFDDEARIAWEAWSKKLALIYQSNPDKATPPTP